MYKPSVKDKQFIIGNDNNLYQVKKLQGCLSCCFFYLGYPKCEHTLNEVFKGKLIFRRCADLLGANINTRLCFKKIGKGL